MEELKVKSFDSVGIPFKLFLDWCEENEKNPNSIKVRREFYRLILDGKLVKEGNKLVKKRVRKHEE